MVYIGVIADLLAIYELCGTSKKEVPKNATECLLLLFSLDIACLSKYNPAQNVVLLMCV